MVCDRPVCMGGAESGAGGDPIDKSQRDNRKDVSEALNRRYGWRNLPSNDGNIFTILAHPYHLLVQNHIAQHKRVNFSVLREMVLWSVGPN
eukprot:7303816-Pyramimonas_sp.AAC.1